MSRLEEVVPADRLDARYPPSPRVIERLSSAHLWLGASTPTASSHALRARIAMTRQSDVEQLILGTGASGLITQLAPAFLDQDGPILIVPPAPAIWRRVLVETYGHRLISAPIDPHTLCVDLAALPARVHRLGAGGLVLANPNPYSGRAFSRGQLKALLAALDPSIRVVIDETHGDHLAAASLEPLLEDFPALLLVRDLNPILALSGAAIGYAACAASTRDRLCALLPPSRLTLLARVAALSALEDMPYYRRELARTHQIRDEWAQHLRELTGLQLWPSTINAVVLAAAPHDAVRLCSALGRLGVRTRAIAPHPEAVASHLRFSILSTPQLERIEHAIQAVLLAAEPGVGPV